MTDVTGSSVFGRAFWRAALDRAVKTAAQAVVGLWAIGDGVFDAFQMDGAKAVGVALGGFALSVVTSIASAPVGPVDSPSTI